MRRDWLLMHARPAVGGIHDLGLVPLRADTGKAPWRGTCILRRGSSFAPLKPAAVIHRPGDSHFLDALEEHFCRRFQSLNSMKKTVEISLYHRFLVLDRDFLIHYPHHGCSPDFDLVFQGSK